MLTRSGLSDTLCCRSRRGGVGSFFQTRPRPIGYKLEGLANTILRLVKAGLFPPPIRIGPRAVAWCWLDIKAWLDSRPLATGENWQ